jgi:hypothetical protein
MYWSLTFSNNRGIEGGKLMSQHLSQRYQKRGFKNRLIQFDRFLFTSFQMNRVRFIGNEAYNYTGAGDLKTMRPRLFNVTMDNFANKEIFQQFEKSTLDLTLQLENIHIQDNIFKNSDAMVSMPRFNLTYHGWNVTGNGRRLEDQDTSGDDITEGVLKLELSAQDSVTFSRMYAKDNHFRKGSVISIDSVEKPVVEFFSPNILIEQDSYFGNNTSHGPAGVLQVSGVTPWMKLKVHQSTLANNWGEVTNDIFAHVMKRFEFMQSTWEQYPASIRGQQPRRDPSTRAKFLHLNESQYQVWVEGSTFDCQMELDRQMVFTLNRHDDLAEPALINLVLPSTNHTFTSTQDRANGEFQFQDHRQETVRKPPYFELQVDCEALFSESEYAQLSDEYVADESSAYWRCKHKMYFWQFHNNRYSNCNQAYQGAIFHLDNQAKVNISGTFTRAEGNSALQGGFAWLKGADTRVEIRTNIELHSQRAFYGGAFYAEDRAHVELFSLKITGGETYEAMIFLDKQATLDLHAVRMSDNLAHHRAMISAHEYSFFMISNCRFENNTSNYDALIIFIDQAEDVRILLPGSDVEFQVMNSYSSVIQDSVIQFNRMKLGGSLIKVVDSNLKMQRVQIYDNQVYQNHGGITLVFAHLDLQNCIFNMAQGDPEFFSDLYNEQVADSLQGGFLYIGTNSSVESYQNVYSHARAYTGGCVAIQGYARATFHNDTFSYCGANSGAAIFATDFEQLTVRACVFESNMVYQGQGTNIFAARFSKPLILENSNFSSFTSSIYLEDGFDLQTDNVLLEYEKNQIESTTEVFYNDTLIMHNKTVIKEEKNEDGIIDINQVKEKKVQIFQVKPVQNYQRWAGGMHIKNMKAISSFKNVTMEGLRAEYGGCLFVELEQNQRELKEMYNTEPYVFANLTIRNCISWEDGAGAFIRNIRHMRVASGSIVGSYAFGSGGGIDYECDVKDLETCQLELGPMNISGNAAKENGGGIYWPDKKPQFDGTEVTNNTAGIYGNDFASFPITMVRLVSQVDAFNKIREGLGNFDIFNKYLNLDGQEAQGQITLKMAEYPVPGSNFFIPSIQSGGFIKEQYLALLDEYNQVCANNKGSRIIIEISDNTTQINGPMRFFSINGVYNVSGMEIFTQPGVEDLKMFAVLEQQGIRTRGDDYRLIFDLDIKECEKGEAQLARGENFICQRCSEGTYLLEKPPPRVEVKCQVCPQEMAICRGGDQIGPRPHYWRKSPLSDRFMPCKVPSACLGLMIDADPATYNPTGNCAEGYYGALCSACVPGWHKQDKHGCARCESPEWNLIRMAGVMALMILIIVFLVRSTIQEENQKRRQTHSVFIKIMMNHMQMILITTSFNMKWPDEILDFFKNISIIVEFQKMIVSFDCWMDTRVWADDDYETVFKHQFMDREEDPLRITYYKLFIYAVLPIICGICSVCVWYVILRRRGKFATIKDQLYIKFISTLVILLYLFHPQITQFMIDMFNCQPYDGEKRLEYDLQIMCWEHKHQFYTYLVALPCFIIWGLGIPAMIYILMSKEKENLDTDAAKIKFGFLYNGYKRANYTWEIVIMYRKIVCLCLSVFLSGIGIIVQALVLLILLVVFIGLNSALRPFAERTLNEIEDISLATQIITIYCGLFFIS